MVHDYYQSFPGAKTKSLLDVYEIHFEGNPEQFEKALISNGCFNRVERMSYFKPTNVNDDNCSNPESEVNDDWIEYGWANKSHLLMTQAYCTWTLTKGSYSNIVAIVDTEFDTDHEDLIGQFAYTSGSPSLYADSCRHGTAVSGLVAAKTNNNIGIASLGYNTRLAGYYVNVSSYCTGNPFNQVWQAYQDGRRIINLSWSGIGTPPAGFPYTLVEAVQEMTSNGVSLICAAGNTPNATHHSSYANIPGVINVSGINHENYHGPTNHAHNQWVDICALSINATTTKPDDNYGGAWGTSFAAPQIAATVALMLTVNPDLTPTEIENIIKESADPIIDQTSFPNGLGAGKLNSYFAVLNAYPKSYKVPTYSTGFDNGLDSYWKIYQSNNNARTITTVEDDPFEGSGHLTMDAIYDGTFSENQACLHLNLSGKTNVIIEFWWKELFDESHTNDGVFISDDGGINYTKIYNLTGGSSTYSKVSINISDEISALGLSHSSNFIIKFQQYDNYTIPTDGMAFDDLKVCAKPSSPAYITGPYEHCVPDWEEYTCAEVSDAVSYEWACDDPGLVIDQDGTNSCTVRAMSEKTYLLKVRVKNACDQYSDWKITPIFIENCDWLKQSQDDVFNIYPNPANESITIDKASVTESSFTEKDSYNISIINSKGLVIFNKTFNELPININSSGYEDGVYTISIIYNSQIYSYELTIKH